MGIFTAIGAFFSSVGAYFGWAKARSDLNNTPEMKAAAEAQKQADADAKNVQDLEGKGDEDRADIN